MKTFHMTVRLTLETDGNPTEETVQRAVLIALRDHDHESPLTQLPALDWNSSFKWDDIAVTEAEAEQIG